MSATAMRQWETVESLYHAHARDLLRLAVLLVGSRAIAEELMQEAFVRYYQAKSPPRPGSELAYLRRTVVNLSHGHHRRRAVAQRRLTMVADVDPVPGADASWAAQQRRREVVDAVRRLSHRQRVCIVLHFWGGLTDAETGDALGISSGSVKRHLHRARNRLAEYLEDER